MSTQRLGDNQSTGKFRELQRSSGTLLPDCSGAAILLEAVKLLDGLQADMSIGQMVLAIAKQTSSDRMTPIVARALEHCDDNVREYAFGWIDSINEQVGSVGFWRKPADEILMMSGLYALNLWKQVGYSENKERFAQFQALLYWFVVFNLVMSTLADSGRRNFVQRAQGVGLLGRLFG